MFQAARMVLSKGSGLEAWQNWQRLMDPCYAICLNWASWLLNLGTDTGDPFKGVFKKFLRSQETYPSFSTPVSLEDWLGHTFSLYDKRQAIYQNHNFLYVSFCNLKYFNWHFYCKKILKEFAPLRFVVSDDRNSSDPLQMIKYLLIICHSRLTSGVIRFQ